MTIKRSIALSAALVLSLGLSACGDDDGERTAEPTDVVTTDEVSDSDGTEGSDADPSEEDEPTESTEGETTDPTTDPTTDSDPTTEPSFEEKTFEPGVKPTKQELLDGLWQSVEAIGFYHGADDHLREGVRAEFELLFGCTFDEAYDDLSVEGAQTLAAGRPDSPNSISEADNDVMQAATDICVERLDLEPGGIMGSETGSGQGDD